MGEADDSHGSDIASPPGRSSGIAAAGFAIGSDCGPAQAAPQNSEPELAKVYAAAASHHHYRVQIRHPKRITQRVCEPGRGECAGLGPSRARLECQSQEGPRQLYGLYENVAMEDSRHHAEQRHCQQHGPRAARPGFPGPAPYSPLIRFPSHFRKLATQ